MHVISYCLASLVALSFAHKAVSASPQQATEIGLLTCGFAKDDEVRSEAKGAAQSALGRRTARSRKPTRARWRALVRKRHYQSSVSRSGWSKEVARRRGPRVCCSRFMPQTPLVILATRRR